MSVTLACRLGLAEVAASDAILTLPVLLGLPLACTALAALEMLDGASPADIDKTPAGQYVLPLVRDVKRPAAVRAQALRLVAPTDPALDAELFASLLKSPDSVLRLETVRTLQHAPLVF